MTDEFGSQDWSETLAESLYNQFKSLPADDLNSVANDLYNRFYSSNERNLSKSELKNVESLRANILRRIESLRVDEGKKPEQLEVGGAIGSGKKPEQLEVGGAIGSGKKPEQLEVGGAIGSGNIEDSRELMNSQFRRKIGCPQRRVNTVSQNHLKVIGFLGKAASCQ
jgi:hypothetical protein